MRVTRRTLLIATAALVAGCEPVGKLQRTILFDVSESAHAKLHAGLLAFAHAHGIDGWYETNGDYFTLQNTDFMINFQPEHEESAAQNKPRHIVWPVRYSAQFYAVPAKETQAGRLIDDFGRAMTALAGVTKISTQASS